MNRIMRAWRGTGPRPTVARASPDTVARGPVPRERFWVDRGVARDRPSPYGGTGISRYRSAGACPPRTFLGRPGRGEGQALALREKGRQFRDETHGFLTHMHHLPNQPNNISRIRTIRIRDNPTPIRIGFDAIPIDYPL